MSLLKIIRGKSIAIYSILVLLFQLSCKEKGVEIIDDFCDGPKGQWENLGLESETVTAIAIDPDDPKILYVGTQFNFSASHQGKLFKSTDCGNTWDTLLVGGSYLAVAIDPKNSQTVYALPHAVIKSIDGGATWQQITNGIFLNSETSAQSIAIDPVNSNILYVGTVGFFGGTLYKSADAGQTWQNKWNPDSLRDGAVSIAIDPQNTNTIYAGTSDRGLVVKSTDAGETWVRTGLGETGRLVESVAIHPQNSEFVYAGVRSQGLMKSTDGGANWQKENLPDSAEGFGNAVFHPTNHSSLYIATNIGVYNKPCENCSWVNTSLELPNMFIWSLAISNKNQITVIYAGLRKLDPGPDGGIYRIRY